MLENNLQPCLCGFLVVIRNNNYMSIYIIQNTKIYYIICISNNNYYLCKKQKSKWNEKRYWK